MTNNLKNDIVIVDLDAEIVEDKNGNTELNSKQKDDLQGFYASINNDVKLVRKVMHKNSLYTLVEKINSNKKKAFIIFTFLIISLLLMLNKLVNTEIITTNSKVPYTGSLINVSMNSDTSELNYDVENISIKTESGYINIKGIDWLRYNADTNRKDYKVGEETYSLSKEMQLKSFDINNTFVYIQYINKDETINKEFILSQNKPKYIDVSTLDKISERFFEKASSLQIKSYINSYDKTFLMLIETLAGGELNITSLKNNIDSIENKMTKSTYSDRDIITIALEELGNINVNELDAVNESPEVIYDKDTKVLRIHNSLENIDYIYIFNINNDIMQCYADDLIETTTEGLFVHKSFDNEESIGYKTFAFKTEHNLYCIKLSGLAHESLQKEVFNQLGIKDDKIEIKNIQRVIEYSLEK